MEQIATSLERGGATCLHLCQSNMPGGMDHGGGGRGGGDEDRPCIN